MKLTVQMFVALICCSKTLFGDGQGLNNGALGIIEHVVDGGLDSVFERGQRVEDYGESCNPLTKQPLGYALRLVGER